MSLKRVKNRRSDALTQVGWQQVESLLAGYYRSQGYAVEHCGTAGTGASYDGGIDLKLQRGAEYVLVQVKHWNAMKVPHNDVHQLLGLMVNEGATGAILVTSGEFTRAAIEAASRHGHVQLVDGCRLREMLGPIDFANESPVGGRTADFVSAMSSVQLERPAVKIRTYGRERPSFATSVLLFVAVCAVVFVLLIRGLLHKTEGSAGPSPDSPAATDAYSKGPASTAPTMRVQAETPNDACKEVIDQFSGTYIDHCAPNRAPDPPSAATIREQKRRADAAAKVIEASTPEM